jgi:hypothetical protein
MKKLIIICLLLSGLAVQAQVGKVVTTLINTTTVADTTTTIGPLNMDYLWNITIQSTTLSAADASVEIEVANASAGPWVDYDSNFNSLLPTTGVTAFGDVELGWLYMRVIILKNSAATGDIKVVMSKYKK